MVAIRSSRPCVEFKTEFSFDCSSGPMRPMGYFEVYITTSTQHPHGQRIADIITFIRRQNNNMHSNRFNFPKREMGSRIRLGETENRGILEARSITAINKQSKPQKQAAHVSSSLLVTIQRLYMTCPYLHSQCWCVLNNPTYTPIVRQLKGAGDGRRRRFTAITNSAS